MRTCTSLLQYSPQLMYTIVKISIHRIFQNHPTHCLLIGFYMLYKKKRYFTENFTEKAKHFSKNSLKTCTLSKFGLNSGMRLLDKVRLI